MSEIVPYVIMVISLDNTNNIFCSSKKPNLLVNIVEKLVELTYDRIYLNNPNSFENIEDLRNKFYVDRYMNNFMWSVMSFINNEWQNTSPTDDLVIEALIKEKERRGSDYISSDETIDKDESYDI
jgi:hypothetical protein